MNAQDPFGLRKKFALPGARVIHARHTGVVEQRPLSRTVPQNDHDFSAAQAAQREEACREILLTEDGDDDNDNSSSKNINNKNSNMAFVVPKNVPSFTNPQRQLEDSRWGSSRSVNGGRSAVGGPSAGPGPAQRMGGLFERRELPMYKDKPYNYGAASRRRRQWWRLKRSWLAGALVFVTLLYWLGLGSLFAEPGRRPTALSSTRRRPSGFLGWLGLRPAAPAVDWDERREAVKDAFLASWEAYERHAWGMHTVHQTMTPFLQAGGGDRKD
jgi:mannosyl-oligosaccharide alpha-1,2-mannosidase